MNDPEEGIKFIVKSRLSAILQYMEHRKLGQTAQALEHLLTDINGHLHALSQHNE